jgi:hypothetical protein
LQAVVLRQLEEKLHEPAAVFCRWPVSIRLYSHVIIVLKKGIIVKAQAPAIG